MQIAFILICDPQFSLYFANFFHDVINFYVISNFIKSKASFNWSEKIQFGTLNSIPVFLFLCPSVTTSMQFKLLSFFCENSLGGFIGFKSMMWRLFINSHSHVYSFVVLPCSKTSLIIIIIISNHELGLLVCSIVFQYLTSTPLPCLSKIPLHFGLIVRFFWKSMVGHPYEFMPTVSLTCDGLSKIVAK